MNDMTAKDRAIIRERARRVADIADLPIQNERRNLWIRHNRLDGVRPLIMISPEGSWGELLPDQGLACEGKAARGIERSLRMRIYAHEHFDQDVVVEKQWPVHKAIRNTGWGLEAKQHPSTTTRGAWAFDPVLKEASDLKKLKMPEITHDEAATEKRLRNARDLFGDILDVKPVGVARVSYHLMSQYSRWRGLEQMMLDMYEEPGMLHDAMAFLTEGHKHVLKQYIDLNLLSLNNDGTYHNSGGNGYTTELPPPDCDPHRVRPRDMWCSAEAQELAQVGPAQHDEFCLRYEKQLLEPWGLNGYGCCEDLTGKLGLVKTIPNIRRISISPFANVDACAEQLKGDYIFSWKPHPSHLVGAFEEKHIRGYIRHTIEVALANGCVLEMILKDTHTCEHKPHRFDRWTRIAREEVNRACGVAC
jgi:hypothetical protein